MHPCHEKSEGDVRHGRGEYRVEVGSLFLRVPAGHEPHLDRLDRVVVVELHGNDPSRLQHVLIVRWSRHALPAVVEHLPMDLLLHGFLEIFLVFLLCKLAFLSFYSEGQNICHLGFGESPFPIPEPMRIALQENAYRKQYISGYGLPELRKAVAGFFKSEFGYNYSFEKIFIPDLPHNSVIVMDNAPFS